MRAFIGFTTVFFLWASSLTAQTCCSAGTPVLSAMTGAAPSAGLFRLSVDYDLNRVTRVFNRDQAIDAIRQRTTQALLLRLSYGFTRRWGVEALLTYIRHQRQLNQPNSSGSLEPLLAAGVGDAIVMLNHNLIVPDIVSPWQWSMGLGLKAPLGTPDLTSGGILLPADMQPGSGSWDGLGWTRVGFSLHPHWPLIVLLQIAARHNGTYNRFKVAGNSAFKRYAFGDVISLTTGGAYRADALTIRLHARYRYALRDRFADQPVANTGGQWLFLLAGLTLDTMAPFSYHFTFTWPVWQKLNEIQLTTTWRLLVGIGWHFYREANS